MVYSEPTSPDPDFNDWYWEGMQGDDTDNIITVDVADDFKDLMQKYLTANSRYDVSSAIAAAFDETTPNVMDGHVEWLFVIWGLLLSGIGAEEALTEEDHTEARITAAIRTEAQEEAHAT